MCRLLAYLGPPITLDRLIFQPEHSLVVQSYQPKEMTAGLLNADGFGLGWYHGDRLEPPYVYRHVLPIWSDVNLPEISRYVVSPCVLAYVRSATPGLAIDLSNCQPFRQENLLLIHNGYIEDFRQTLYRPIRNTLDDRTYQQIKGTTDSEHIFALVLAERHRHPELSLLEILGRAIDRLDVLARDHGSYFSANVILSDGKKLVACRHANRSPVPTLYWLRDDPAYPGAVLVASEPVGPGDWQVCPEHCFLSVEPDLDCSLLPFP